MDYDKKIFNGKSVADLMEEAYKDKQEKHKQLKGMISMLKDLIQDGGDAVMMVPLIKEIIDLSIKNDDVLIRLLSIIQKIESSSARSLDNNDGLLSEKDKQLLFESLDKIAIGE